MALSYTQFYYTGHKKPVQIDCSFNVLSSNPSGITGLTGAGVSSVYMHTSDGSPTVGNPNPGSGIIVVNFMDSYSQYYFGGADICAPVTGSNLTVSTSSVLTAGQVYVITALGSTTAANWVTLGVPPNVVPAVGVSFVALVTSGTGSGTVKAIGNSGISRIEKCANPIYTISAFGPQVMGSGAGNYILLQCLGATNSSTTTLIQKAPADGSLIKLSFLFSQTSVVVQGS